MNSEIVSRVMLNGACLTIFGSIQSDGQFEVLGFTGGAISDFINHLKVCADFYKSESLF